MKLIIAPPPSCPECGSDAVRHKIEYIGHTLDALIGPSMKWWTHTLEKALYLRTSTTKIARYERLARLGLGELRKSPDDHTLLLHHVLWQEAERRGITMQEFRPLGNPKGIFIATLPNGSVLDFEGLPLPYQHEQTVWWIDTKSTLKKKFKKVGIPVPQGGAAYTNRHAHRIFNTIPHPIVIKPFIGSASRHTTMHISSIKELDRAFGVAKQLAPLVMVEEELVGAVYRPTLVDGKLIATLRRDQPFVWGDGIHTVEELVTKENTHPARSGPYFSPVCLNEAASQELSVQGLTLGNIPEPGRRVQLHPKINWGVGGTTTDVTDDVHHDNIELFERIAKLLKAPVVGIDFIIEDISRSWKDQQKCGVIECNSMPYFDNHHLPFQGLPRNVAGPIWDLVDPQ